MVLSVRLVRIGRVAEYRWYVLGHLSGRKDVISVGRFESSGGGVGQIWW